MSDSVRDEVRAALARAGEAPLRSCPRCGREERTRSEQCSHCGTSYFARPPAAVRRRRILAGVAGVIVLAALVAGAAGLVSDRKAHDKRDPAPRARPGTARIARPQRGQGPPPGPPGPPQPPARATPAPPPGPA